MKISIRQSVFETNSSSTHALTLIDLEEYTKCITGQSKFLINKNDYRIEKYIDNKYIDILQLEEYKNNGLDLDEFINLNSDDLDEDISYGFKNLNSDSDEPLYLDIQTLENGQKIPSNYIAISYKLLKGLEIFFEVKATQKGISIILLNIPC
jgi:hypothetical protein